MLAHSIHPGFLTIYFPPASPRFEEVWLARLSVDAVGYSEVSQLLYRRALARCFPVDRRRIVSLVSQPLAVA